MALTISFYDQIPVSVISNLSAYKVDTFYNAVMELIIYLDFWFLELAVGCDSVWSTERTPGYFMRGVEQEIIRGISRLRCTERCLDERRFVCR